MKMSSITSSTHARSLIFSASIPPSNAAAALAALHVMREEPERVQRVNEIADRCARNTATWVSILAILDARSSRSISAMICALSMTWKLLFDDGVFVNPVISPAVPGRRQLLRTSYMATHTDEQLDRVLEIFAKGRQAGWAASPNPVSP